MAYRRTNRRGRAARPAKRAFRSSRTARSSGARRSFSSGSSRQQTVRIVLEAPGQQSLPGTVQQIAAARIAQAAAAQPRVAGRPSTQKM